MVDPIQQLDKRFKTVRPLIALGHPPRGWVRAIRDALGMTTRQLGERIGVSQPRVVKLEQAEIDRSITLDSLDRAAEALGCRVVYALVPEKPLSETLRERAQQIAARQLSSLNQTMSLESQAANGREVQDDLRSDFVQQLLQHPARLWDAL
jgi:predicted DNA-binding mobile mystery protein A